jgi:hypothetical protein
MMIVMKRMFIIMFLFITVFAYAQEDPAGVKEKDPLLSFDLVKICNLERDMQD